MMSCASAFVCLQLNLTDATEYRRRAAKKQAGNPLQALIEKF